MHARSTTSTEEVLPSYPECKLTWVQGWHRRRGQTSLEKSSKYFTTCNQKVIFIDLNFD